MPRRRRRIRMRVGTAPVHPGTFRGKPSGQASLRLVKMLPFQWRRHSDLQCTCSTWQRAQVIPRPSSAMPCDDAETVEHAYARHTLPRGPSPSATSTPRRLHTHAPSRSASTHPPRRAAARQMSHCSTRGRPWRTCLVRRLAAGTRARSAHAIDAERVARRRRWRRRLPPRLLAELLGER